METEKCKCATECEWLPEHYTLEHHPACPVIAGALIPLSWGQSVTIKRRIINAIDPAVTGEFLQSAEGEAVILNRIRKNPSFYRAALRLDNDKS